MKIDPDQWRLVLENLVVNACDAMPRGGKLTIETANVVMGGIEGRPDERDPRKDEGGDVRANHPNAPSPHEYVRLTVSDTGCGMDHETQSRVFEPFFSTKGTAAGTALGLATVYGIVMQSGGLIELESEPGRGTTFKIYIPRCRDDASALETPPQPTATASGNETVLLVEDEEPVRTLVRRVLERNGYAVMEACHAQEALSLADDPARPIDILISDLDLPGMSGRELADRLRRRTPADEGAVHFGLHR